MGSGPPCSRESIPIVRRSTKRLHGRRLWDRTGRKSGRLSTCGRPAMMRFLLALPLVLGVASPALAQTVTLKLATIVGNDNPFTTSAIKFKEVAEARSGGRIKVEVYPAGQLAKNEIVQLEGMQLGTVDVAAVSLPSIRRQWDPKMLATHGPFLYTGREHRGKGMGGGVG